MPSKAIIQAQPIKLLFKSQQMKVQDVFAAPKQPTGVTQTSSRAQVSITTANSRKNSLCESYSTSSHSNGTGSHVSKAEKLATSQVISGQSKTVTNLQRSLANNSNNHAKQMLKSNFRINNLYYQTNMNKARQKQPSQIMSSTSTSSLQDPYQGSVHVLGLSSKRKTKTKTNFARNCIALEMPQRRCERKFGCPS